MYPNIINYKRSPRSAFVLAEALVASLIALFIFLGSWSIYHMAWRWWHETMPLIEAQRTTRIALTSVINGMVDPTAGQDATYTRRNGIAWAVYEPDISSNISTADKIQFGLEGEKEYFEDYPTQHNIRAFYLMLDPITGSNLICYLDNNSETHQIKSTTGITDLKFEKFKDINNKMYIKVTVKVEKDIIGTRGTPYHIKTEYVDYVYLRNV